jgi:predicted nucleotidyltransferase
VAVLTEHEVDCVERYLVLLARSLGERLAEVRMFGSAARGEMWPTSSSMHSDIDLLVVTGEIVGEREREELLNETYPLFLECGRQISPHFYTRAQLTDPDTARLRQFVDRIAEDVIVVWPVRSATFGAPTA